MTDHEAIRQESDKLKALADELQATEPTSREEWEAIDDIRTAARYLFSAAGWLSRLETQP